jgi:cytosine/adenosine deaminase-related metal-dependent hydrolase
MQMKKTSPFSVAPPAGSAPAGDAVFSFSGRRLQFPGNCACCDAVDLSVGADRIVTMTAAEPDAPHTAGQILMPAFANGHDHVRGVPPTALAAFDLPLELWLAQMSGPPACDPFLIAAAALGRQALSGCGSIMVHYTRPQDPARIVEELKVVAAAARAVGVRVAIAPALRDINALGYAVDAQVLAKLPPAARAAIEERLLSRPPGSPAEQVQLVDEVALQVEGPLVDVQYGPYGPEWCSDALLTAVAEASTRNGRRVHMHLMESKVQREYLDARYPQGPLRFLDSIGLLSPRLSIAHAVWLRPDEMDLLAERGVSVSINTSSNLGLRNGTAPVAELYRRGVPLAQGLDGFSVDDDDDAFRELRLNYMLHRGTGFEEGIPLAALFHAACHGGRRIVTGDGGAQTLLQAGAPADFMVLDRAALAHDLVLEVADDVLVAQRATKAALRHLFVDGREIVRDGVLQGLDLPALRQELMAQVRHGAPAYRDWRQVTTAWAGALREAYMGGLHRRR